MSRTGLKRNDEYRARLEAEDAARTPADRLQALRESGPYLAADGQMSIAMPSHKDVAWAVAEIDRLNAQVEAEGSLVREILVSLCEAQEVWTTSSVDPPSPARNYELADRLGIGGVFFRRMEP